MRRSTPQNCTILVTQTGRQSLLLSVKPLPLTLLLVTLIATPLVLLFGRIHQLRQENQVLIERNSDLSETATEVAKELNQLDAEIDRLEERAGLSEVDAREPIERSRGGIPIQLAPEEMLAVAEHQLPSISLRLHRQVKPALTNTLAEEAARAAAMPTGKPAKGARISSKFGMRPNPFGRGFELHNGIDFPGATGTPIHATGAGTVEKAASSRGYGQHVIIDHGYGYKTLYAHLSKMAVTAGDSVEREDIIGLMGSTGRSTGPHLHYSVYYHGDAVDPQDLLSYSP
ncbi:MAG: peptidoglycan DD-metalloendopeptidase family protein [Elainellaceae cyanobacterium]